jgi:hypothetical protein
VQIMYLTERGRILTTIRSHRRDYNFGYFPLSRLRKERIIGLRTVLSNGPTIASSLLSSNQPEERGRSDSEKL